MIDATLLDRVPLFQDLGREARRELAVRSVRIEKPAGEVLWHAGDRPRGLVILLEGRVRIVRSGRDGRRQVVHREGPGVALGEVPLLDGGGYPATAEVERPIVAVLVTPEALDAAMAADPCLARTLLDGLARRVRHLVDRLDERTLLDVRARLARHVLERAEAAGGEVFDLGMTQARLAEELGTVREVVVRNLGRLRRRGVLVNAGRARYRVGHRPTLEALADGVRASPGGLGGGGA